MYSIKEDNNVIKKINALISVLELGFTNVIALKMFNILIIVANITNEAFGFSFCIKWTTLASTKKVKNQNVNQVFYQINNL
jgi:hypothetical protein